MTDAATVDERLRVSPRLESLDFLRGLVMKPGFVARDVLPKLADAGVLLTAAGERVIRFSPPLVVSVAELEEGVRVLRGVIAEMAAAAEPARATAAIAHI